MNKKTKVILQAFAVLVALFAGAQVVSAATFTVGNNPNICPIVNFTTIQSAVDAAMPGDTVNVCPGTYTEQVTIEKSLTLRGIQVGSNKLIIVRPNTVVANDGSGANGVNRARAAIILVRRASGQMANPNVTVQNILVDGVNNGINGCAPDFYGIFYRNASGTIIQNSIKNIRLSGGLFGCQTGEAIRAFADDGNGGYNLFILENVIDNFQKTGITVFGGDPNASPSLFLRVAVGRNTINGAGPTNQIAQNGIQLAGDFAVFAANVPSFASFNTISNLSFTGNPAITGSAGILLFDIGTVNTGATVFDVQDNNINRTDSGILASGVSQTTFRVNDISNTIKFEGILLETTGSQFPNNNNTFTTNRVFNTKTTGIAVLGDGNQITNNRINDADIGIAANGSNTVSGSTINNVRLTISNVGPGLNRATTEFSRPSKAVTFRIPSFERAER